MSTISLRIPKSLHERVKELAKHDGVSVNQFVAVALSEKLSFMHALDYVEERAKRASREKYDSVLAKAPDRKPLKHDRLR